MNPIDWLLHSTVTIAGSEVLVREIVGNVFGLASALFGMRRLVSAWPVGIVGNVLLFTVFVGGIFDTPQDKDLWGQAGRQVFFAIVSLYGWYRWYQTRHGGAATGVQPRWATARERLELGGIAVVLYAISYFVLRELGSWGPQWDAWILTGSILATYGMARGFVEFWLIWIAVDVVGVPLLVQAKFYPSATMYIVYGLFCVVGFVSWWKIQNRERVQAPEPVVVG
ncbi:nicotinamide mononucleotide transporter [Kribbella sp. VKM Ac-2571]|uniref:nicotinamide riboside transporter PnuC n=1 Tax=unclassified Kribbella TaxID=2644121 RepID=UPI00102B049E|nr:MULTISPECIES: nicotinamide riboside transporter PnuC [unclassified Kribbella]RZT19537.1 nicotinamide mononucleotide transporter [Kribbella sp. VKM Ac-2569]TDO63846.1 nicotinamide mononucleotide transporter [Kribbella sp. VKM Ac-2571]